MKKKIIGILVCTLLITTVLPVAGTIENSKIKIENTRVDVTTQPSEEWNKTYGGNQTDGGYMVQRALDDGYIVVGVTASYGSGAADVWLIKTDGNGNEQWNKTYGGVYDDYGVSIRLTSDGGYIIVGWTGSYGVGEGDVWLIKTDGNGNEQWNKTYGGIAGEVGFSVQQTTDNGYIIAGGKDIGDNLDIWLIKTDGNGNEQWNKTYGGLGSELPGIDAIQQTTDGGYIVVGYTGSYGNGNWDIWLIKTDGNGNEQWNKTYGGIGEELAYSIQPSSGGGYIITGYTESYGAGNWSTWLIKTNATGDEQWNTTFGGTKDDFGTSVQQTTDGGFIVTGGTQSFGAGDYDVWLIRIDSSGYEQWNTTFGGTEYDLGTSIQSTIDGGYIIAGFTASYGAGNQDVWLIKIKSENSPPNKPNKPTGETSGKLNTPYVYSTNTTDPNGDQVWYFWDWGDGTNSTWLGPYNSGATINTTHTWTVKSSSVKVKAKDSFGAESPWSDPLPITMPYSFNKPILQFLELFFQRFPHAFPLLRHLMGY